MQGRVDAMLDFGTVSGVFSQENKTDTRQAFDYNHQGFHSLYFNASNVSSIYQDNLTEVRVNALFGMFLIRSY